MQFSTSLSRFVRLALLGAVGSALLPPAHLVAQKLDPVGAGRGAQQMEPDDELPRDLITSFKTAYTSDGSPSVQVVFLREGVLNDESDLSYLKAAFFKHLQDAGVSNIAEMADVQKDLTVLAGRDVAAIARAGSQRNAELVYIVHMTAQQQQQQGRVIRNQPRRGQSPVQYVVTTYLIDSRQPDDPQDTPITADWFIGNARQRAGQVAVATVRDSLQAYIQKRRTLPGGNTGTVKVMVSGITQFRDFSTLVKSFPTDGGKSIVTKSNFVNGGQSTLDIALKTDRDATAVASMLDQELTKEEAGYTIEDVQKTKIVVSTGEFARVDQKLREDVTAAIKATGVQTTPVLLTCAVAQNEAGNAGAQQLSDDIEGAISTELLNTTGIELANFEGNAAEKQKLADLAQAGNLPGLAAAFKGQAANKVSIIVSVHSPAADGSAHVGFTVISANQQRKLAVFQRELKSIGQTPPPDFKRFSEVGANVVYRGLIRELKRPAGSSIFALNLEGFGNFDEAKSYFDALNTKLAGSGKTVEFDLQPAGRTQIARAQIPFSGAQNLFVDTITSAAADAGLPIQVVALTPQQLMARIGYQAATPMWFMLTEPDDKKFAAEKAKMKAGVSSLKSAQFAVLINCLTNADGHPAIDVGDAAVATFKQRDLRLTDIADQMQQQFAGAGFTVRDAMTVQNLRQRLVKQNTTFRSESELLSTLLADDHPDFDIVALGLADSSGQLHFKLVDLRNGSFLGTASYPSNAANAFAATEKVNADAPGISRFLTGTMLEMIARHGATAQEMMVTVKDASALDEVMLVASVFQNDAAVVSADNFRFEFGLGMFRLRYNGDALKLLGRLTRNAAALPFKLIPDTMDDRKLVLELKPQKDRSKEWVIQREPGRKVDAITHSYTPAEHAENQPLQKLLLEKRASVCVVGLENNGVFSPLGTAWTVGKNRLATNVHVVVGLAEAQKRNPALKLVGKRGAKLETVMQLGGMTAHPGYGAWLDLTKRFNGQSELKVPVFDVGLIEVTSDNAGQPLELATSDEVDAIQPGDTVAYIGFPMEGKTNIASLPSLMQDIGPLSAYTNVFYQTRSNKECGLLHYTLRSLGGASGSPVFSATGKVIGLNSAGDAVFTQDLTPVQSYLRVVVTPSGGNVVDAQGRYSIALLAKPGLPVLIAENHVVVQGEGRSSRELAEGEKIIPDLPSNLLIDSQGVVLAVREKNPRLNGGFSYGQSVEMLKELLDGTAATKQAARSAEWERTARALKILK